DNRFAEDVAAGVPVDVGEARPPERCRGKSCGEKALALRGVRQMPMDAQSLILLLIIGAIAGWLAGVLVKGYGFGLIGNIIIGILGAGLAGLLAPRLGLYTESLLGNIVAATLGALVLLLIVGLVRRA